MKVPFTTEQFLNVFERYNLMVFPMQIVLSILALVIVYFAIKKRAVTDRLVSAVLSLFWIWAGLVYHLMYFSSINDAAYSFGILFIIQGILFSLFGTFKSKLSFRFRMNGFSIAGGIFIFYSLFIYPLFVYFSGHAYPATPTFGVPCPITIFTFGILLWTDKTVPKSLLIIPILWSIVGLSAAINFSIHADYGLLVTGILGTILIFIRDRRIEQMKDLKS